jgi:serine phosphatase RsbU (regulator of sigma subunit)
VSRAPVQPLVTSDLSEEFDAHTQALLRERFIWFSGSMAVFGSLVLLVMLLAGLAALLTDPAMSGPVQAISKNLSTPWRSILTWSLILSLCGAYASCFFLAKRGKIRADRILTTSYLLVMADGLLQVSMDWAGARGSPGLLAVMISHIVACSFLPWTPAQALRPIVPVLALHFVLALILTKDISAAGVIFRLLFASLTALPGVFICWIRQSRRMEEFKLAFFQRRYGQVRRELFDARKIHEALFPIPIQDGPVQFSYFYEPMHQIGGDYLYAACAAPGKPVNIVLMDVTGHGIPAALTVNRLHGELQRLFAEHPDITPGQVLSALNKYVFLTLADHAVFVTALCLRFDPFADTVEYASGGHPTAYLRAVDGTIHELPSTALMLGVSPSQEFDPAQATLRFQEGDSVIAYTDGALEARNAEGRMIGLRGMQRMVAGMHQVRPGGWPQEVIRAVESYRKGPPNDDTLVIEVFRPIGIRTDMPTRIGAATPSRPQPV